MLNDLQTPGINGIAAFDVEVPDRDIRWHTTTAFSAQLRSCPVQIPWIPGPRLRARCSIVATAVKETATLAGPGGERNGDVETAQHSMRVDRDVARHCQQEATPVLDLSLDPHGEHGRQISAIRAWAPLGCRRLRSALGTSLRTLPPMLELRTVTPATCSHIPIQLRNFVVVEESHCRFCHVRVSSLHARDAVSRTGPMRGLCTACSQTQA